MTSLWIFICLLLVIAFAIIWRHFFKSKLLAGDQENMRGQTNKELYHEHLAELEKDLAEGGIDEENFSYLKEELDRSLLIDMTATLKEKQAQDKKTSLLWPSVLSFFIVVFSAAVYSQLGQYEHIDSAQQEMPQGHPDTGDGQDRAKQMIARMKALQEEVQSNPTNSEAWYQLGQMLGSIGEYDSAYVAYAKVNEIEGTQADILALQAQVKFYQNGEQINDEVQTLLDKALAIDPNEPSSLMLIGMNHYLQNRFAQAADTWQRILDANTGGSNSQALESAVNQARQKAGLVAHSQKDKAEDPHKGHNHDEPSNQASTQQALQPPVVEGPALKLNVTLSDSIVAKLNEGPDRTVFIYAIPSGGARMPLAAIRVQASDLPLSVTLDNSKSMRPEINLSAAENVDVLAVISLTGKPGMQKGDYKAEIKNISVNHSELLNLTIDTVVE